MYLFIYITDLYISFFVKGLLGFTSEWMDANVIPSARKYRKRAYDSLQQLKVPIDLHMKKKRAIGIP